jgi:hypothetical protein
MIAGESGLSFESRDLPHLDSVTDRKIAFIPPGWTTDLRLSKCLLCCGCSVVVPVTAAVTPVSHILISFPEAYALNIKYFRSNPFCEKYVSRTPASARHPTVRNPKTHRFWVFRPGTYRSPPGPRSAFLPHAKTHHLGRNSADSHKLGFKCIPPDLRKTPGPLQPSVQVCLVRTRIDIQIPDIDIRQDEPVILQQAAEILQPAYDPRAAWTSGNFRKETSGYSCRPGRSPQETLRPAA